jgi:hypothetical protein
MMSFEPENRSGDERRQHDPALSPGTERRSGEEQRAAPHRDEMDLSRSALREGFFSAMRRRAERRQSSAPSVELERRSGEDQRASPSSNDIDKANRQEFFSEMRRRARGKR